MKLKDIYDVDDEMVLLFNDETSMLHNVQKTNNYIIPLFVWQAQQRYIEKLEKELWILKAQTLKNK